MPAVEPNPEEGPKTKKEPTTVKKKRKRELEGKHKPKSNFQEYLEMEMGGAVSMEEDLEMERRLAKKLKVKKGKLGGPDDGMDELFADLGFGGDFGSDDETEAYDRTKGKKKKKKVTEDDMEMEELGVGDEENDRKKKKKNKKKVVKKDDMETEELDNRGEENNGKKKKKRKKKLKKDDMEVEEPDDGGADMDGAVLESEDGEANVVELSTESKGKYVPPSLRASSNSESEEIAQMRRRVRGLSLSSIFYLLDMPHYLSIYFVLQLYSLYDLMSAVRQDF